MVRTFHVNRCSTRLVEVPPGMRKDFLTRPCLSFLLLSFGGSRKYSNHTARRLVSSLGNTFLDARVRVFFVRSPRTLRLCLRSRGLTGIGSGDWWVSGMAGSRRGDLGSACSLEACVQVQTWERDGNRRRNYCRGCVPIFPESGPPFPYSGPLLG